MSDGGNQIRGLPPSHIDGVLILATSETLGRVVNGTLPTALTRSLEEQAEEKECCKGHQKPTKEEVEWGRELVKNVYIASETVKILPRTAFYSDQEICYDGLGCFSQRSIYSHFSLPSSPKEVDTKFMLYSRKNRQVPVFLDYLRYESLGVDQFKQQKSLVFIVHGFGEDGNATWILKMKDAFLEMEDVNVVAVDWNKGCPQPMYLTAAANTALVGRQIARLVEVLAHRHPDTVVPAKVHLVGFSLGAQVAGFAGRSFNRTTGKKIGRITGLDAAGPLFESYGIHVNRHDAQFVDGIHTSAGRNLLKGCLGMKKPYGNANFYPNGGKSQPGCWFFDLACHHRRSVEYFMESIQSARSCQFKALKCPGGQKAFIGGRCGKSGHDWGEMGYHSIDARGRGEQYLWTNDNCPFCMM
ncbi:hypothetical protein HPB47_003166 [Ixodes persulcatus]|uniref:Uncharacterized protein n=1 Tax=Ixodes persulcatus TaxID=34615 RepID=A0AC60PJI0_IXOPE|nr:hypothetical protein HPB47_003166 [Ixodes persulcatus]